MRTIYEINTGVGNCIEFHTAAEIMDKGDAYMSKLAGDYLWCKFTLE